MEKTRFLTTHTHTHTQHCCPTVCTVAGRSDNASSSCAVLRSTLQWCGPISPP